MKNITFIEAFSILKQKSDAYVQNKNRKEEVISNINKNAILQILSPKEEKEVLLEIKHPVKKIILEIKYPNKKNTSKNILLEVIEPKEELEKRSLVNLEIFTPNMIKKDDSIYENQFNEALNQIANYAKNIKQEFGKVELLSSNVAELKKEDTYIKKIKNKENFIILGKIRFSDKILDFEEIVETKNILKFDFK